MKIVHTADWHLAYRQYGFAQREEDFYLAAEHIARRTIELKADAIIIAGDMFDMPKPPAYAVKRVADLVAKMRAAGVHVVGVDGNHDATGTDWLRVCGITPVSPTEPYKVDWLTIGGLSSCRPTVFWKQVDQMVEAGSKCDIFILHQPLGEFADFEAQGVTALELAPKLDKLGVKYVAMGDIHDYKEIELGGIRFVYPGSIEVNAMNETHDKVFCVSEFVQLADGQVKVHTGYEPIPTRQIVNMNIAGEKDVDELLVKIGSSDPLVMLWYEAGRRDLVKKAEAVLIERGLMHRACPIAASSLNDITAQLSKQQFERKGALLQLKDAVNAFFEENSAEYQLVFQLLDAPDNVTDTIQQYMKSNGVN